MCYRKIEKSEIVTAEDLENGDVDLSSDELKWDNDELWNADPECKHEVVDAPGGGVVCKKCGGWCCF